MAATDSTPDETLIEAWLTGRPKNTRIVYRRALLRLQCNMAPARLVDLTLSDLRRYLGELGHLAPASQAQAANAIKSFYAFQASGGVIATNPAAFLKPARIPSDLAERILTEEDIQKLLASASKPVERIMLHLLYLGGLRASELCGARWRDLEPLPDGSGKITVLGKGAKKRSIILPVSLFGDLVVLEPDNVTPDDPIFAALRNWRRHIGQRQLLRIVKRAAIRAGLSEKVSSHWLRHCHASHAIDRGAPLTLVRDTLGHANLTVTNRYAHARPNDGSARFLTGD